MKLKKMLAGFMTLCMMATAVPVTALADENVNVAAVEWDGTDATADTSWYNDTDTEFVLTTAAELAGLAKLVNEGNDFAGKIVKLGDDIDLHVMGEDEPVSFRPIGDKTAFAGTFDGDGKTIYNLYQSGWAFGYEWGKYGSLGLFGELEDATVKNLTISGAECFVEGGDVGGITGSATGTCVFEDITIEDSVFATYNNGNGGIIGWSGDGEYTFEDIKIADDVVLAGLWGSFDSSIGGIVGQAKPGATYNFENVDIACRLDVYNDCTASYDYYNYRMCGMIMGRLEETTTIDGTNYPDTSKYEINCEDVTVTYGDWMDYHYCDPTPGYNNGRGMRVEPGYAYDGLPDNYDHSTCTTHHMESIPFDQIFGGDQYGVKGLKSYDGVTVKYYVDPALAVARIDSEYFLTLEDAVKEAVDGDTITLLADVELTETLTIADDKEITLDLNGKTVSMEDKSDAASQLIKNKGTLTIDDSKNGGKLTFATTTPSMSNSYASNTVSNYGVLTVKDGTIENTSTAGGACYAIDNYAGSTCTIKGGTISATKTTVRIFNWTEGETAKATLHVIKGEIVSNDGYGINVNSGNAPYIELNISGGTITTKDTDYNLAVYVVNKGNAENEIINVTDGTFNGYFALNGVTCTTMAKDKVSVSGGAFDGIICYDTPQYAFVSGGYFVDDPSDYVVEGESVKDSDKDGYKYMVGDTSSETEPTPSTSSSKKSSKKYSVDIEDTEDGTVKASSTRVKKDATVTLTVTPDEGYELDDLVVLDKDREKVKLKDKGNGKYTFTMPRGGVEVEASFVEKEGEKEPVATEKEFIKLTIGQKIVWIFDEYVVNDVTPEIKNDRTMLPIRIIAEALGAKVTWNEAEQKVTIAEDDLTIEIFIGQPFATVNGKPVQLDAPAYIANGRTYLPLRFVAENLGATVEWNAADSSVTIFK